MRHWTGDIGRKRQLNCYDQGGLVQIALGLGPLEESKVKWKYLEPFGFIHRAELIGRMSSWRLTAR